MAGVDFDTELDRLRAGRRRRAEFSARTGSYSLPKALAWFAERDGDRLLGTGDDDGGQP